MDTSGLMDVDESGEDGKCRPRVNGRLLAKHRGRPVCLVGRVVACPTSTTLSLTTSDSVQVKAVCPAPVASDLAGSIVELVGMATSDTEVSVSGMVSFADSMTAAFDMDVYNKAVEICDKFGQAYYQKR